MLRQNGIIEYIKKSARSFLVYIDMLKLMSKGSRLKFFLSFIANILISQLPVVMAYTSQLIIDSLSVEQVDLSFFKSPLFFGCIYLVFLIIQNSGQVFLTIINENLTATISKNLHLEIMKTSIRLEGLYYYENPAYHNRRAIVENSALYLPMNFLNFSTDIYSIACILIGMITLLMQLNPLIPLLIIVSGIPQIFIQRKAHRLLFEGVKETTEQERYMAYYRSVLTEKKYAKDIRLFDLKDFFLQKYTNAFDAMCRIILPIRNRQIKKSVWGSISISIGTTISYVWTISEALAGNITAGQIVMFMTAIIVIHQQLSRTAQTLAGHQDVKSNLEEFYKWISLEPDIIVNKGVGQKKRASSGPPKIRIDDVWFKYPGCEEYVLSGFDLDITSGKSLAIVGKNGSGKSTLVKLICRLYDPERGSILFDEANISDISLDELRASISVIFQDYVKYDLTIQENIAFSNECHNGTCELLNEAVKNAKLESLINESPGGYDTLLGKQFSNGMELSGGQWQRVALARGFYNNSGLIIMDEPTAAIDIETEAKIYNEFKTITEGKTSILISHRLSTVKMADHIAVIDNGKVLEFGDHNSLMRLGGIYFELFNMQAEKYKLPKDKIVC